VGSIIKDEKKRRAATVMFIDIFLRLAFIMSIVFIGVAVYIVSCVFHIGAAIAIATRIAPRTYRRRRYRQPER